MHVSIITQLQDTVCNYFSNQKFTLLSVSFMILFPALIFLALFALLTNQTAGFF